MAILAFFLFLPSLVFAIEKPTDYEMLVCDSDSDCAAVESVCFGGWNPVNKIMEKQLWSC